MKYGIAPFCDSWASSYAYRDEDLIKRSYLKCEDYVHPSIPIHQKHRYNDCTCTLIITNSKNPVDPAGPDCYRIDTKPCESL